uniref:FYVE-type domain-containing protein n=1 Tax=viral metagenome TaxID=1070528 RepID=A0A6C0EHU8_9ZZZZ
MNKLELSMLIDKEVVSNTHYLENRKAYTWIKDKNIENCYKCNTKFTILNRKHHCRSCGKIFCGLCSNFWCKIPDYVNHLEEHNLWGRNIIDYLKTKTIQRVCQTCYTDIYNLLELVKVIKVFDLLPLTLKDYLTISLVCKSWNKIANYYFSYFRDIQYYLPTTVYNKKDVNIIYNNIDAFSGHSSWGVHLILLYDTLKISDTKLIDIIKKDRFKKCSQLLCKSLCKHTLNIEDIIICLNKNIYSYAIVNYLLESIASLDSDILLFYLHNLVYKLRFYSDHPDILKCFTDFLMNKSKESIEFSNIYFWLLTNNIHTIKYNNLYATIRKNLINSFNKDKYALFISTYDFTNNIIKIIDESNDIKPDVMNHFRNNNYFISNNLYLPINILKKITKIDVDNIAIINSKTKPLIIPFYSNNKELYQIMIKKEDIRKEYIIMSIIKLINYFLLKDLELDLNITTYNILPVSNKYGYIEFVNNSYTLYGIKEIHNFSIQNFIMEKNPDITVKQLRNNFTKSCASYCVISYLLGIGDRHLDNIMITHEGYIFNIDFGYILGIDPKLIAPEFRITSEMIDAMGGLNSKYYTDFKLYCSQAYNCLRKHTNIFYTLLLELSELEDNAITKDYIKKQVLDRFIPTENYKDAEIQFNYKIVRNSKTYTGEVIDYIHKKAKGLSNSNQTDEKIESIYDSAINVIQSTSTLTKNIKNGIKNIFS